MGRKTILEMPSNVPNIQSLGEDDCERPACSDTVAAMRVMMKEMKAAEEGRISTKTKKSKPNKEKKIDCPPNSAMIGRGTWALLHSMAAWYPDKPSENDQISMNNFIQGLAKFYPCTYCAEDFRVNIEKEPVKTKSRVDLCQWLCEQHNDVNKKLGKKQFPCDMGSLDERWRKN